jgi:hypothetical protein
MAARDLKLGHLTNIRVLKPPTLRTGGLADVAAAFVNNLQRVKALSLFPLLSTYFAHTAGFMRGAAVMNVTGTADITTADREQNQQIAVSIGNCRPPS